MTPQISSSRMPEQTGLIVKSKHKLMNGKCVCLRSGTLWLYQFLRTMKITLVFVFLTFSQLSASVWAQRVNIELKNASLREIFEQIKQQTGVSFMYSNDDVKHLGRKDFKMQDAEVSAIVESCLEGTGLTFELTDRVVIIRKALVVPQAQKKIVLKGIVRDKQGESLPGVAVMIKGTSLGVSTDINGKYELNVPEIKDMILVYTFVGMKPLEVRYTGQPEMNVALEYRPFAGVLWYFRGTEF